MIWQRRGVSLPAASLGRVEIHMGCRTDGIVRIDYRFDQMMIDFRLHDGRRDSLAGHVGQFLIHKKSFGDAALAVEAVIEPLPSDALELTEEIELGLFARIAELRRIEQPMGQMKE